MLRGYYSPDGNNWELAGWEAINLTNQVFMGLAVCSHDPAMLGQAQFDQVQTSAVADNTLPAGTGDGLVGVYYEKVGQAMIKLAWSSPSTPVQLIPTARLHSSIKDSDADGMPDDWETRHELDPQNPADAGSDPDKDGLTIQSVVENPFRDSFCL
jgi:hypothetical protein